MEAQQSEASEKPSSSRKRMTPEDAAYFRKRESLRLARLRVLRQLEAALNPQHRKLLEDALRDLDEKLKMRS